MRTRYCLFSPISSANLFVLTAWTQTAFSVLAIVLNDHWQIRIAQAAPRVLAEPSSEFRPESPFSSSARSQLLVLLRYMQMHILTNSKQETCTFIFHMYRYRYYTCTEYCTSTGIAALHHAESCRCVNHESASRCCMPWGGAWVLRSAGQAQKFPQSSCILL